MFLLGELKEGCARNYSLQPHLTLVEMTVKKSGLLD